MIRLTRLSSISWYFDAIHIHSWLICIKINTSKVHKILLSHKCLSRTKRCSLRLQLYQKTCTRLHFYTETYNLPNSSPSNMNYKDYTSWILKIYKYHNMYIYKTSSSPTHGIFQVRHVHHWKCLPWSASPEKGFTYVPELDSSYSPHN